MIEQIIAANGQFAFCVGKLVLLVENRRGGQLHLIGAHVRDGEAAFAQGQGHGAVLTRPVATIVEIQFLQQIVLDQAHAGGIGDRIKHGGYAVSCQCGLIAGIDPFRGEVRVSLPVGGQKATLQLVGCTVRQVLQSVPGDDSAIDRLDAHFVGGIACVGDGVRGSFMFQCRSHFRLRHSRTRGDGQDGGVIDVLISACSVGFHLPPEKQIVRLVVRPVCVEG